MKSNSKFWIFGAMCALAILIAAEDGWALTLSESSPELVFKTSSTKNGGNAVNAELDQFYSDITKTTGEKLNLFFKGEGTLKEGPLTDAYSTPMTADQGGISGLVFNLESGVGLFEDGFDKKIVIEVKTATAAYVFDVTKIWDGIETINFKFAQDASHVSIRAVPDGGMTIALLGFALGGCGAALRFWRN